MHYFALAAAAYRACGICRYIAVDGAAGQRARARGRRRFVDLSGIGDVAVCVYIAAAECAHHMELQRACLSMELMVRYGH